MNGKKLIFAIIKNSIAVLLSVIISIPFIIVLLNSFKTQGESYTMSFSFPKKIMWENYQVVIDRGKLGLAFFNSFFYSFFSTLLLIIITLMAAYVVARSRRKIMSMIYYFIIFGISLPINNITLMKVMSVLGLFNNRVGIIILYAAIGIPISFFIAHGFIQGIPREMDEAAIIDGCNAWQLFGKIIVPLLKPVFATLFVLNFMGTWNDFTMAIYYLNDSRKMPMTLAVYNFFGQYTQSWNLVCADIVLTALPVLIVYILGQKYIVDGMTSGAVKG
jgi:raffinose/stachyose/melibiose transport system permease protein